MDDARSHFLLLQKYHIDPREVARYGVVMNGEKIWYDMTGEREEAWMTAIARVAAGVSESQGTPAGNGGLGNSWKFASNYIVHKWLPGSPGKGYVDPNGDVITWNVDESGYPHHTNVR